MSVHSALYADNFFRDILSVEKQYEQNHKSVLSKFMVNHNNFFLNTVLPQKTVLSSLFIFIIKYGKYYFKDY
jgi:hypothetical protein